jgi:hypothetical protein
MIQPRGSALISFTSIQPDSRVITIGAASEFLRFVQAKLSFVLCIDVVVEFVIVFSFPEPFAAHCLLLTD